MNGILLATHGGPGAEGATRVASLLAKRLGVSGPAVRTLLSRAKDLHADLIALGSHGYGAVKRTMRGSVVSMMIRFATTAVLVVPVGVEHGDTLLHVGNKGDGHERNLARN